MSKKITDININFAENGVIVRVSKEEETDDPEKPTKYDNETMVFKNMSDAEEWLKRNAPDLKSKWEGKIGEALTNG
jgi:hypothetical protein